MKWPVYRKIAAASFILACLATPAAADSYVEEIPTNWRLQDYNDGNINLWYTSAPSPCTNGHLILVAANSEVMNRLWSLVMTAKVTGKTVGVYYNSSCQITNFYLKEG